jgi:DNA mismatch repair protein MutS
LENRAGRLTEAASLPLFAAMNSVEPVAEPEPETPDPVRAALAAVNPDQLTPREALDTVYRLRGLLAVAQRGDAITSH